MSLDFYGVLGYLTGLEINGSEFTADSALATDTAKYIIQVREINNADRLIAIWIGD